MGIVWEGSIAAHHGKTKSSVAIKGRRNISSCTNLPKHERTAASLTCSVVSNIRILAANSARFCKGEATTPS
eukprot:5136992-Amphidinium_carterae.1